MTTMYCWRKQSRTTLQLLLQGAMPPLEPPPSMLKVGVEIQGLCVALPFVFNAKHGGERGGAQKWCNFVSCNRQDDLFPSVPEWLCTSNSIVPRATGREAYDKITYFLQFRSGCAQVTASCLVPQGHSALSAPFQIDIAAPLLRHRLDTASVSHRSRIDIPTA